METLQQVNNVIRDRMSSYSAYVLLHRAIPNVFDGLKPVHRRILYSMYKHKTYNYAKSANVAGRIMMIHPHGNCLAPETKMPLLNGNVETFKSLAERNAQEWVLSVDDNGNIVPGFAHSFRKTKRVKEMYKIQFTNGFTIESTGDHKFRTVSGDWVEAKDLRKGHFLDFGKISNGDGYPQIFGSKTKCIKIHKLVSEKFNGKQKELHIHHIDKNTLNNSPNNLKLVTNSEHRKIHCEEDGLVCGGFMDEETKKKMYNKDGELYEKIKNKNSQLMKQVNKKNGLVRASATLRKMEIKGLDLTLENYESMRSEVYNLTKIETLIKNGDIKNFEDLVSQYKNGIKFTNYAKPEVKKEKYVKTENHQKSNSKSLKRASYITLLKNLAIKSNHNLEIMKEKSYFKASEELPIIESIELIEKETDVYDFSVEKHHNAMISASEDNKTLTVAHNCYGSMVGLVQKDRQLHPLLEGKGNFGQYTSSDLQPAADRYSEVRLSEISKTMLQNFDKNIVDFELNYDGTQTVPVVLPVKYPAILTQAQKGIGVGFSSSIPSYNLKEVCQATIDVIDGKDINLIPDFATGGYIEDDKEQFESIMNSGLGSVKLRAKYEIKDNEIIINELPYGVKREKVIDDIIKNVKNGNLQDIKDVRDLTGLNGMKLSIILKKNSDAKVTIAMLYKLTSLESKYSVNMNILADSKLKVLGVKEIISKWIEWRKECVVRALSYDIEQLKKKVHLYEGLEKVLLDIDKAIELIRNTKADRIYSVLKKEFSIDESQSAEVLKMPLRNINKDYLQDKIDEIEGLKEELKKLEFYLEDDESKMNIIKKGLQSIIKDFGADRKTEIIKFDYSSSIKKAIQTKVEKSIDKNVDEIIITKQGFLYKNYKQSDIKLSPGDSVSSIIKDTNDTNYIYVIFKNKNEAVGINVKDIKESNKNSIGQHINSFTDDSIDDEPVLLIDKNKDSNIVYIYKNGKAIVINSSVYDVKRRLLKNSKADEEILYAKQFDDDYNLDVEFKKGKKLTINTADIVHKKSRNGVGAYITRKEINNIKEA